MAEDRTQRTEEPTPRRKEKAREEGQVASSKDLTTALQFLTAVGMISYLSRDIVSGLLAAMRGLFRTAFRSHVGEAELRQAGAAIVGESLMVVGSIGAALLAVGLVSHMAQTGFALAPKRLAPDLKRLNPLQKMKDLPGENLMQTGKAVLLLPLLAAVFWYVLAADLDRFLGLPGLTAAAGTAVVAEALLDLLTKAAIAMILLGVLDFYRQRRKLNKKLMMSKHDVRQEHKDLEGNPQIKARMRRMQREMMRRRMMSEVPTATVVVTNPTHFAVALRYDPQSMPAPRVVAKGLDHMALRIRAAAEEHRVPIVENPPLAQALYRAADVGSEIPEDMFRAVAEILAYIFTLRGEEPL